jgi:hypothetical protein
MRITKTMEIMKKMSLGLDTEGGGVKADGGSMIVSRA